VTTVLSETTASDRVSRCSQTTASLDGAGFHSISDGCAFLFVQVSLHFSFSFFLFLFSSPRISLRFTLKLTFLLPSSLCVFDPFLFFYCLLIDSFSLVLLLSIFFIAFCICFRLSRLSLFISALFSLSRSLSHSRSFSLPSALCFCISFLPSVFSPPCLSFFLSHFFFLSLFPLLSSRLFLSLFLSLSLPPSLCLSLFVVTRPPRLPLPSILQCVEAQHTAVAECCNVLRCTPVSLFLSVPTPPNATTYECISQETALYFFCSFVVVPTTSSTCCKCELSVCSERERQRQRQRETERERQR